MLSEPNTVVTNCIPSSLFSCVTSASVTASGYLETTVFTARRLLSCSFQKFYYICTAGCSFALAEWQVETDSKDPCRLQRKNMSQALIAPSTSSCSFLELMMSSRHSQNTLAMPCKNLQPLFVASSHLALLAEGASICTCADMLIVRCNLSPFERKS